MDEPRKSQPILATLLSGILPGTAAGAFRQALASSATAVAEVEQIDEALGIFGEACITFSDSQRALVWLTLPSDVFGGQPPLAMLHTSTGRDAVRAQLARIEHGIFY